MDNKREDELLKELADRWSEQVQNNTSNRLSEVSTTELKAELRRRKKGEK